MVFMAVTTTPAFSRNRGPIPTAQGAYCAYSPAVWFDDLGGMNARTSQNGALGYAVRQSYECGAILNM